MMAILSSYGVDEAYDFVRETCPDSEGKSPISFGDFYIDENGEKKPKDTQLTEKEEFFNE